MEVTYGTFEELNAHAYGGGTYSIPVLLNENRSPSHPLTEPLLHAAELMAPKLKEGSENHIDLPELLDRIGHLLVPEADVVQEPNGHPDPDKILIEDDNGAGAIIVDRKNTVIALRNKEVATVPSELFFGMLYNWDKIRSSRSRRATDQSLDE